MTPIEKAWAALTLSMGRHGSMDKALEAAITAYLQALPEDVGTVEKVAQALCEFDGGSREYAGQTYRLGQCRAALLALAAKEPTT